MLRRRNHSFHRRAAISLLLLLWLVSSNLCRAEDVSLQLRNGDRITGAIVAEDQDQVTLDIEFIGVVDVPVAQIKSRKKVRRKNVPKTPSATPGAVSLVKPKAGVSAGKRRRLEDLFARYKAGAVTPTAYQEQRVLILAEPATPITPPPSLSSAPPAASAPKPSETASAGSNAEVSRTFQAGAENINASTNSTETKGAQAMESGFAVRDEPSLQSTG